MSIPTASVVIGVYNRSQRIVACLDSLLASTFRDFEIVLVDDASTDNSRTVLEQYVRGHPEQPFQLIRNQRNRGASGARNMGVESARGEFVLFTDSDCVVEKTWIAAMVAGFRRTGAAAVSGTVMDKRPSNLAERAYVGSCLITSKTPNLMESNMGWRRELGYRLDEAIFNGEGDDLARLIRAEGRVIALVPEAVTHHHHALDFSGYMRMARNTGRGHTLYWYKHGEFLGRDILAGALALFTLPLGLADARLLAVPAALAILQLWAILFNETYFKCKTWREALAVLPVQLAYYAVRTATALRTWARILLGLEPAIRDSKRRWLRRRLARGSQSA